MRPFLLALLLVGCGHSADQDNDCGDGPPCCHSSADCTSPENDCFAPGVFAGCGACRTGDGCQADTECTGVNMICEVPVCSCMSEKACIAGCIDNMSCGIAQECGADHRCHVQSCVTTADCPDFFICGSGGTCARETCDDDGDCDIGVCVNGGCYERIGQCGSPPA